MTDDLSCTQNRKVLKMSKKFKVTAVASLFKSSLILETEQELNDLLRKARSQMNKGHTVTFGRLLINPKYLHAIEFEIIEEGV